MINHQDRDYYKFNLYYKYVSILDKVYVQKIKLLVIFLQNVRYTDF